ncbi:HNH endonuclease signature motif containing protein [uncultured Metabacillus sp.]|uniref:HNH endonuclease n=1 Tax=uncultured Metabacillus sp. TaxID=2860135 RepID=UPI0026372B22|nr:HNH endonuclease signature motif containing protein [uncultured Metabacillus sp.]
MEKEMKKCTVCGENKPLDDYYMQKKTSKKKGTFYVPKAECKECSKKQTLKWQYDNYDYWKTIVAKRDATPEKKMKTREAARLQRERGDQKKWRKNNPDKTREYSFYKQMNGTHNISNEEWVACKEYFNNSCAYCGLSEEKHKNKFNQRLHKEHVDHEGSNDLNNCVPACRSCNGSKWIFDLEEWYNEENKNFTKERLIKIYKWINEDYKKYIKVEENSLHK